jgi:hypothetical protein
VVSFDRPYAAEQGAGDFLGNELPLVRLVESLGLDVTYWTDIDLDRHPGRLLAHRALVSLGHDRYWSTRMRRGAEAARARGVNLAFLGANAVYRHIRLRPSPTGPDREEVNYKPWSVTDDPAWKTDPSEFTTDWRRPPLNDPESRLLGAECDCKPTDAAGVVAQPSAWLLAGTGCGPAAACPDWWGTSTTGSSRARSGRLGSRCCCTRRCAAGGPASPTPPGTAPAAGPGCSTRAPAPGSASWAGSAPRTAARRSRLGWCAPSPCGCCGPSPPGRQEPTTGPGPTWPPWGSNRPPRPTTSDRPRPALRIGGLRRGKFVGSPRDVDPAGLDGGDAVPGT